MAGARGPLRVLCAGDRFITAAAFAEQVRLRLGEDTEVTQYETDWPSAPFGPVEGVREASGDPHEIAGLAADVDVVLTHLAPLTEGVFEAAKRLRVVGSVRGGPVNVDLAAASARGVPVVYLPGRNLGAVAEFTVGVMITLPRSIARASHSLAAGQWDARYFEFPRTGPELSACRVGLIGLGAVGLRVAELLRPFGAEVVGHDPYADPEALAARGITPCELPELVATSDIVSLHSRLSDDTRGMFDDDLFAQLKPGPYFVNTARGELVRQDALLRALESGRLAGAALDVFDPEPPAPDDPLLARPDVLATPHLAGASRQVALQSADRVVGEVAEFLATAELAHCANPDWADHGRGGSSGVAS